MMRCLIWFRLVVSFFFFFLHRLFISCWSVSLALFFVIVGLVNDRVEVIRSCKASSVDGWMDGWMGSGLVRMNE